MKRQKLLTKKDYIKLLIESVLIIFSVLLALFLNEYRGNIKEKRIQDEAFVKINHELMVNLEVLNEWLPYHQEVLINLRTALKSDSSRATMVSKDGVYFWGLMPRGVVQRLLDDAAWSALKSSNVFANIDFKRMLLLSKLYKLQSQGVETTLRGVLEIMYSREALNPDNLPETLMLLERGFGELVSQEDYLINQYQQAMTELNIPN